MLDRENLLRGENYLFGPLFVALPCWVWFWVILFKKWAWVLHFIILAARQPDLHGQQLEAKFLLENG